MGRKIKICIETDCQNAQTTKDYCRLHYLKNWKKIRGEEKQRETKRLNRYVEGIMKRNYEKAEDKTRLHSKQETRDDLASHILSSSEEVDRLIEDLGYADPQSVDHLIENLKVDKDY